MKYCYFIYSNADEAATEKFMSIVEPVVTACDYHPFEIDRTSVMGFAIDSAEKLITASELCIADISSDNPNVWYEIGFAYAACKEVIMICSKERTTPPPFSISHRNILMYDAASPSWRDEIKNRLWRRLSAPNEFEEARQISKADIEVLKFIYNLQNTPNEAVPKEKIASRDIDAQTALKRLTDGKYIEYIFSVSDNDKHSVLYRVTQSGTELLEQWRSGKPETKTAPAGTTITMESKGTNGLQIGQVSGGTVNIHIPAK